MSCKGVDGIKLAQASEKLWVLFHMVINIGVSIKGGSFLTS